MSNLRKFYSRLQFVLLGIVLTITLFLGGTLQAPTAKNAVSALQTSKDIELAKKVGKEIIATCPVVSNVKNVDAYNSCSEKLSNLKILRNTMSSPFLWGAQKEAGNYNIKESNTTAFEPFVWRRIYLATFMFKGEPKVEQVNNLIVIHLPTQFRNQFDIGAYPYPFWHSSKKWDSYQQTTELLLFMEQQKVKGALRSAVVDKQRPKVEHTWDGNWVWTDARGQEPFASLYTRLFSPSNPHITKVDAAYRAFEVKLREHTCVVCHSPDNASKQNPLLLLSYPNQALSLRHETVRQIEEKLMPPPAGIIDDKKRQQLIEVAKAFAEAGDKALAYEGEKITPEKN
ncbi:hypothetical protein HW132_03095 [Brasilonema sp. CT11]|nr:hypothetical protein [Brasilonema sp. CT11]